MPFDSDYQPIPAPPPGRNWADAHVCVFHGCPSILNLMNLPGFPRPLDIYPTHRRLWRPQDHVDFRDALTTERFDPDVHLPELDIEAYMAERVELRRIKELKLRRKRGLPGWPQSPA